MLDFSRTQDTNTNSNIQIPKMANTNMTTFRAGSNTLGFAKYFAYGTGEDSRGCGRQNKGEGHWTSLPLGLWRNSTPF